MRRLAFSLVIAPFCLFATGCFLPLTAVKAKTPKGAYPEELDRGIKEVKEMVAKPDPGGFYDVDSSYTTTTHMSGDFKKLAMDFTDNDAKLDKVYSRNSIEMMSAEDQLGQIGGPDRSLKMLANLRAGTNKYYEGDLKLEDRLASWLEKYSGERPNADRDVRARIETARNACVQAEDAMKDTINYARDHHPRYNRNLGTLSFDKPEQTQEYLELMAGTNSALRVWYRTEVQLSNTRRTMIDLWMKQVDASQPA